MAASVVATVGDMVRPVIADVVARLKSAIQKGHDQLIRFQGRSAGDDLDPRLLEELNRPAANAADNDMRSALLCNPRRNYARGMRRGAEIFGFQDDLLLLVNLDHREELAMSKVHTQFSVRYGQCDFHGYLPSIGFFAAAVKV